MTTKSKAKTFTLRRGLYWILFGCQGSPEPQVQIKESFVRAFFMCVCESNFMDKAGAVKPAKNRAESEKSYE